MKKSLASLLALSASTALASLDPASAQNVINAGTTSNTAQGLSSGGATLTVQSTGTLNVISSGTIAVTVSNTSGTATITNNGLLEQTNGGRAIRSTGVGAGLVINNTGTITATGSDAFQEKATGSVTINNYGTISTTHSDIGAGTTGTGDQAVNMNILNANGTTTAYSNTVNNFAGGVISSYEADGLRPGAGGFIYNSGTISSTNAADNTSSSDAIDAQVNNTGVTIVNGSSTTTVNSVTSANLIEGARHGITGGQQTDTAFTSGTSNGNSSGVYDLPFTISITNNANSTIQGDNGSGINIDGVDGTELVTVVNTGTITGNGRTGDGDGIDVDGLVNITNNTGGKIISKNAFQNNSEGVTVGGGTITNAGLIEGSTTGTSSVARGITLAGIDHTTTNKVDTDIPIQSIYADTTVTNNSGGLIKGDTESGITVLGTSNVNHTVTINNNAGATIDGSNTGVTENVAITTGVNAGKLSGGSLNQAVIELDDAGNNYVINESGTITQETTATGSAIAMHGKSNALNITGGSAKITGNIAGDTAADSLLTINPGASNGFSYGGIISNFTVKVNGDGSNGNVTLSGANTYSGGTTVSGGYLIVDNASGSGTGTGKVAVASGAILAGAGIIQPGSGNGVTLAANSKVISGDNQSGPTAVGGLTLDNTVAAGVILDASLGNATLSFALGANHSATTMDVLGNTAGEIKLAAGDTISLFDLTSGGLTLNMSNTPYVLIAAGTTPGLLADNNLYAGITTTGGKDANGNILNGYVTTPLNISYNSGSYSQSALFLNNGELEVVPEPGTWALMLGGLGMLVVLQLRRRQKI
jgi:hypothetical protein